MKVPQQRAEIAHLNRVVTTGQLAASIAHEINQPLTAIMANAATLQVMLSGRGRRTGRHHELVSDIVKLLHAEAVNRKSAA